MQQLIQPPPQQRRIGKRVLFNGILFRSILEATWAQFFQQHGIAYEYEPVVFRNGRHSYKPDFAFHDRRIFLEIKDGVLACGNHSESLVWRYDKETRPYSGRLLIKVIGTPGRHHSHIFLPVSDMLLPPAVLPHSRSFLLAYEFAVKEIGRGGDGL